MPLNPSDIAILTINGADGHCIINGISKNYAINLLQMLILTEGRRVLQKQKIIITVYKMGKNIIMFGYIGAEKHTYHQHQGLVLLYDEKTFFGKKKF